MPEPEAERVIETLSHVLSLSRQMTVLDETGISALQALMSERADCIARVAALDLSTMADTDRTRVNDVLAEIHAADEALEARWRKIQMSQFQEMKQLSQLHGALGHYQSGIEPASIGVENHG